MRKNKKKIAIITGSLLTGGAEAMVAQLATHINRSKYEVKVICIYKSVDSPIEQLLAENNIETVFLNKGDNKDYRIFFKVFKVLNVYKPDVVHSHLSGAIYSYPWFLFHKTRLLHTLHTVPEKEFSKFIQKFLKFYYKIGKAKLVTVSPVNHLSASQYYGLSEKKVGMIFNPVNLNKYYKNSIPKKDFTFINVGRQDGNKNQKLIISAMSEILKENDNIKLILVGDGDKNQDLRKLSRELDIESQIIFTGITKDVETYLAMSDVYIQSSRYEGLPLSILEAMAAGLPIISTKVGGISDIVTNNGILIPDNNITELTRAMKKLIENRNLRETMSENSIKNVKKYDSSIMADKYCELYEELI